MRIIAGGFRGRRIIPPQDQTTRPITDRAKQSLFDILAPFMPGARVYDCFAGTGSLGLECLSRGAEHVTFFESNRSAVARLRRNLRALRVELRSTLISQDLFRWFAGHEREGEAPAKPNATGQPRLGGSLALPDCRIQLVFLDPPYSFVRDRAPDLCQLAGQIASSHLADDGIVIFRHDSRDHLELTALARYDQREYGGMTIELLRKR
jgi:16S rRNA G966 N2-methylase RsmD